MWCRIQKAGQTDWESHLHKNKKQKQTNKKDPSNEIKLNKEQQVFPIFILISLQISLKAMEEINVIYSATSEA